MKKLSYTTLTPIKILLINGSHRKGNTQHLLQTINNLIVKSHSGRAQPLMITLRQLSIQYVTQNDYSCALTRNCTCCRDDMAYMYPLLEQSQVIVFGTPIYFYQVSAKMKTFIDRFNPYVWDKKLEGKKAFLIGAKGSTEHQQVKKSMEMFVAALGMEYLGEYFAKAESPNSLHGNYEIVKELKQIVDKKLLVY